ncbi:MAG: hypothetical protein U0359_40995 [Byssovorax sp.]
MNTRSFATLGVWFVALSIGACGAPKIESGDALLPPPPPPRDLSRPLDQGLTFINAIDEAEVPRYLGRGIKDDGVNISRTCLSYQSEGEWKLLDSPVPTGAISKSENVGESYYDVIKRGAKGNAGVNLLKLQGVSVGGEVGGSSETAYFYRLDVKKTFTLMSSGLGSFGQSIATVSPSSCGDNSCGNSYVAIIKCGDLTINSVKSTAFDANGGLKIDAWDVGVSGELKAENYAGRVVSKRGCFVAYPVPYSDCGSGNYCESPYQDGVADGGKCAADLACLAECLNEAKYDSKVRRLEQVAREEYLEGLRRGHLRMATKDETLGKILRNKCKSEFRSMSASQRQQ